MQIAQRKYEETRSRVHAQRARQEKKEQQGTALQRIAGGLLCSDTLEVCCPFLNLRRSWLHQALVPWGCVDCVSLHNLQRLHSDTKCLWKHTREYPEPRGNTTV